ncbi:RbsD/FucU family protein [Phycisphaera mikurensis]|uniref:Uncharacterized protein n=1 Tax=Phycisphaera mikurensis (strain NBRC 102666 / KCTC 22515 / FYK2301M01) TaxID=1142394 RepID=I0IEV2_PHYMF|nr:RbsD/FucU family protein [Phycisphaera mikurensis]MBB6441585.1 L-fucose mutarotase [Phycisphaera mikurensis]BAM03790.1 hypothetical protein PSMK_16310 [Phycisphaera mikurensis NBRC 102666]
MLKTSLTHPEILGVLGRAGHLARVLITDGNYPHSTRRNPAASTVWANFRPGLLGGATALELVCDAVPVEAVAVMEPEREGAYAMTGDPPVWAHYRRVLAERAGFTGGFDALQKPAFNREAMSEDLCLVIATGEQALFANILLTIGVVQPAPGAA